MWRCAHFRTLPAALLVAALLSDTVEAASCGGQLCTAGQRCVASAACGACNPGTYQAFASHANASCLPCPLGYTCNSYATTGLASNVVPGYNAPGPHPCISGTFDDQGGLGSAGAVDGACTSCADGRRSAGTVTYGYPDGSSVKTRTGGATECADCTPGFAGRGGSCSECEASSGKYQPSSRQPSCLSCAPGVKRVTGLNATAPTAEVCVPCTPGFFQPVQTKNGNGDTFYNGGSSSLWPAKNHDACAVGC